MAVAIRVLTAINECRSPDAKDVEALRSLEPLLAETLPLDELACEVIQQALKRRNQLSRNAAG